MAAGQGPKRVAFGQAHVATYEKEEAPKSGVSAATSQPVKATKQDWTDDVGTPPKNYGAVQARENTAIMQRKVEGALKGFDPAKAWLKGGRKTRRKRVTRKRKGRTKWTSSGTRKRT